MQSRVAEDPMARGVSKAKAVLRNCFKGSENSRDWNTDGKIEDFKLKREFSS